MYLFIYLFEYQVEYVVVLPYFCTRSAYCSSPGPTPTDLEVATMKVWDNLITLKRKSEEGEVTNCRPSHTLHHMIKAKGANNNKNSATHTSPSSANSPSRNTAEYC